MRQTIRYKIFISMFGLMISAAIIFMLITYFFADDIAIHKYKQNVETIYILGQESFNPSDNLDLWIVSFKEVNGAFLTVTDTSGRIIASSSPHQLDGAMKMLPDIQRQFDLFKASGEKEKLLYNDQAELYRRSIFYFGYLDDNHIMIVQRPLGTVAEIIKHSQILIFYSIIATIIILIPLGLYLSAHLASPIKKIIVKTKEIEKLDFSKPIEIDNKDEIGDLANGINAISDKLSHSLEELQVMNEVLEVDKVALEEKNKLLEIVSSTDSLTGVYNRFKITDQLFEHIHVKREQGHTFSAMILDIDHFKKVNDQFGHNIGDAVLKAFTKVMEENIDEKDIIGRWGGEEFIIIMPLDKLEVAVSKAERLREQVENYKFNIVGQKTVSIGVGEYVILEELHDFVKRIDDALYQGKDTGRNKVVIA